MGCIGLTKALLTYDPSRGQVEHFARKCIKFSIVRLMETQKRFSNEKNPKAIEDINIKRDSYQKYPEEELEKLKAAAKTFLNKKELAIFNALMKGETQRSIAKKYKVTFQAIAQKKAEILKHLRKCLAENP